MPTCTHDGRVDCPVKQSCDELTVLCDVRLFALAMVTCANGMDKVVNFLKFREFYTVPNVYHCP